MDITGKRRCVIKLKGESGRGMPVEAQDALILITGDIDLRVLLGKQERAKKRKKRSSSEISRVAFL